ncbi:DEAD/DEAH box helicase family protein [Helicobacter sp. T3_23-1059]
MRHFLPPPPASAWVKDRFNYPCLNLESPQNYLFANLFTQSIAKINPHAETNDIKATLQELLLSLDYDDLGRTFYTRLTHTTNSIKLIDFENFANNTFHAIPELTYKNGDDEFRPDITLLINGLPLAFIEVKIPHNKEGIIAEYERMHSRLANKKFKNFFNALQILVFSNNQEYDSDSTQSISGAFYATVSSDKLFLNRFREQDFDTLAQNLLPLDAHYDAQENAILQDNNAIGIKNAPEFHTNKEISTPTNRLIISLFSKPRLAQLLKYGIAYVKHQDTQGQSIQKHIMRYQQFFAQLALKNALDKGTKRGIIWHTQGSGKTAFAFYNVKFLQDYFAHKGILTKFYFIVDRLDLKSQAQSEFEARGLRVRSVNSKAELQTMLKDKSAISNAQGADEITIINIQQIPQDTQIIPSDYAISFQRIYFIDEAHRSYAQNGSYLANLLSLDKDAIFISLTGTPLLGSKNKASSTDIWGDYIHQYYYNDSIADGYTLRLIREDIQTHYKENLKQAIAEIEINNKDLAIAQIYAHKKFVTPMLEFIANDFKKARIMHDSTLGAMIVCSSSNQAKTFLKSLKPLTKPTPQTTNAR